MTRIFISTVFVFLLFKAVSSQHIDGTIDTTFHIGSGANRSVTCIAIQSDNKILVGGWFTSFNGFNRNLIVRLLPDGEVDTSFVPSTIGWGSDDELLDILPLLNGQILVGGDLTKADGQSDSGLKLLNADGSIDTSFNGYVNGDIFCLKQQNDGKILASGLCSKYSNTTVKNIFRLNTDFTIDSTFNTLTSGANSLVSSMLVLEDGNIVISGGFTTFQGYDIRKIGRLSYFGEIDSSFNTTPLIFQGVNYNGMSIQFNNKLVLSGDYKLNNISTKNIVRINLDGSLDTTFNYGGSGMNDALSTVIVLPNDQILVGGSPPFTTYNEIPVKHIVRLNSDGSLDQTFSPIDGPNGSIYTMLYQSNGRVLLGGVFTQYDGISSNRICRIHAGGSTGVEDALQDKGFAIYPNPANDYITISAKKTNHLHISNMLGQVVYEANIHEGSTQHSIAKFSKGMYYVKVGETVQKLIIE